jgi:hypothetical protein
MTGLLAAADRWLLAPAPPERLATLRILVGGYCLGFLVVRFPGFLHAARLPERQFEPVGPLVWMPASVSTVAFVTVLVVTVLAGVAFVAGWRWRWSGPGFAVLFLLVTTYRLSWGHVLHTEHLAALHLLVIGFSAAATLNRDREARPDARFGWPVRIMALLTVTTYVLAGLAKVRLGGMGWLTGDVLRNQVAYDNLRKELLGDLHSPLGGWLVHYGWVFVPLAALTVAVELAAPVALRGGRVRTVWVALAWSFHVGIAALMAISFPYQMLGIAYAPLFRCERLLRRRGGRERAQTRSLRREKVTGDVWSTAGAGTAPGATPASAASPWPVTHSGSGPSSGRPVNSFAAMHPPWQAS